MKKFSSDLHIDYYRWNNSKKWLEIHMADNKMKSTKNNKKSDGKFRSKHIKHDPQAESARAVFGLKDDIFQNKFDESEKD